MVVRNIPTTKTCTRCQTTNLKFLSGEGLCPPCWRAWVSDMERERDLL